VKMPEKAPAWEKIFEQAITPEWQIKTTDLIRKANNEYMFWDDIKYQPMPESVTPEKAWAMLKLSRMMQLRKISLADQKRAPIRILASGLCSQGDSFHRPAGRRSHSC